MDLVQRRWTSSLAQNDLMCLHHRSKTFDDPTLRSLLSNPETVTQSSLLGFMVVSGECDMLSDDVMAFMVVYFQYRLGLPIIPVHSE